MCRTDNAVYRGSALLKKETLRLFNILHYSNESEDLLTEESICIKLHSVCVCVLENIAGASILTNIAPQNSSIKIL